MNDIDKKQFETEGYVLVRDVADAATVKKLRDACLEAFAKHNVAVLSDGIVHYPEIYQLLKSPKLVDALGDILGKPFAVPPHSSAMHNGFGYFHTDTSAPEIEGWTFHKQPDYRMVTVAIYLQDNDEYGGGIRLVPRSHRQPDRYVEMIRKKHAMREKLLRSPLRRLAKKLSRGRLYNSIKQFENDPLAIDVPSKAGDAIIWDMRMIHRASPQKVKGSRHPGGKVGVFFTAGANNDVTTKTYMEYVKSLPENSDIIKTRETKAVPLPAHTEDFFVL